MTKSALAEPRPVTPAGILAAKLVGIRARLDATDRIGPELRAEIDEVCELAAGLEPYLSRCTTPESAALQRLAQATHARDWDAANNETGRHLEQEMLSGHVEGQLLKMLVRMTGAKRVLEVGMFTGYSALAMAEALPAGGMVDACEIDADVANFAQERFIESDDGDKITVHVGPAGDTLTRLAASGERFDLVFLDADKAGYLDYLTMLLDTELLAPRGVICADNTLMQGEPYRPGPAGANGKAIAAFNDAVIADPRVEQVLVPLRDGLTLIRRVEEE